MCFIDKLLSLVDDIFAQKVFITHGKLLWVQQTLWVFLSSGIIQDSKIRTLSHSTTPNMLIWANRTHREYVIMVWISFHYHVWPETRGLMISVTQLRILKIGQLFLKSFPHKSILCKDLLPAIFVKSIRVWIFHCLQNFSWTFPIACVFSPCYCSSTDWQR